MFSIHFFVLFLLVVLGGMVQAHYPQYTHNFGFFFLSAMIFNFAGFVEGIDRIKGRK